MLAPTALLPDALRPVQSTSEAQELFCSIAVGFLRDLSDNGVAVTDVDVSVLAGVLNSWPPKHEKRGKEILKRLAARNRIVSIRATGSACQQTQSACTVASILSDPVIQSNNRAPLQAVVSAHRCCACPSISALSSPAFRVDEYPVHEFYLTRHGLGQTFFVHGMLKKSDFEALVLRPLFAFGKHLKIVDRYVGRSVAATRRCALRKEYADGIEWIVDCFRRAAARPQSVEILCGIETSRHPAAHVSRAVRSLRTFESRIKAVFPGASVAIKDERSQGDFPHSRYLITDQVAVLVERGFDLLCSDTEMRALGLDPGVEERRIRDVMVAYCRDPSAVEAAVRRLRDL